MANSFGTSSPAATSQQSSSLSTPALAGLAVGVVAGVVVIAVAAVMVMSARRRRHLKAQSAKETAFTLTLADHHVENPLYDHGPLVADAKSLCALRMSSSLVTES